jgi:hypothetical protein
VTGRGINSETSSFGMGDLFVQPLWLGGSWTNWELALGYGFYAPVGKYNTETVTLPVVGPIVAESADNIGIELLDAPVSRRGGVVSVGRQAHGDHRRVDIRDSSRSRDSVIAWIANGSHL